MSIPINRKNAEGRSWGIFLFPISRFLFPVSYFPFPISYLLFALPLCLIAPPPPCFSAHKSFRLSVFQSLCPHASPPLCPQASLLNPPNFSFSYLSCNFQSLPGLLVSLVQTFVAFVVKCNYY